MHSFRPSHARATASIFALAAIVLVVGCSSDSKKSGTSTPTAPPVANLSVKLGLAGVASAGAPVPLADADRQAVLNGVSGYIQSATLEPLQHPNADPAGKKLAALLAPSAAAALTGPEHDALTDIGVGPATKAVNTKLVPVSLAGLADRTGAVDLIGATLDLTVSTQAKLGPITIHRTGELMFIRDGSAWKILGFKLAVERDGAGLGPVTSTASGSTRP